VFLEQRLRWTEDMDMLEALRQDERTWLVPVVVLTRSSEDGLGDRAADSRLHSHPVIMRNPRPRRTWALVH
jgi:hypothetical protein